MRGGGEMMNAGAGAGRGLLMFQNKHLLRQVRYKIKTAYCKSGDCQKYVFTLSQDTRFFRESLSHTTSPLGIMLYGLCAILDR